MAAGVPREYRLIGWLELAVTFFGVDGEYWKGGETDEIEFVELPRPRGKKEREEEKRSGCGKVGKLDATGRCLFVLVSSV